MNTIATQLDAQVRTVCPHIDGVWIGNPSDKTTWGIWFQPLATSAEREDAQAVIEDFIV